MKAYETIDNKTYKIELYYSLGGMNYFSGSTEKRGIYFSISPVSVSRSPIDGHITTEIYQAFSGSKVLIKELIRKNNKEEKRLWYIINEGDKIKELLKQSIEKKLTAEAVIAQFKSELE